MIKKFDTLLEGEYKGYRVRKIKYYITVPALPFFPNKRKRIRFIIGENTTQVYKELQDVKDTIDKIREE